MTLAVCMIVKDGEATLPAALESVEWFPDQILIGVDTRTTDRTREIARVAGAKVIDVDWTDSFSAMRNAVLDHVTTDWVLILDADEILTGEGYEIVLDMMEDDRFKAHSFFIDQRDESGTSLGTILSTPRLWRNDPAIRYVGRVHEQVTLNGRILTPAQVGAPLVTAIVHTGYSDPISRSERNTRLAKLDIRDGNMSGWFHLARQYLFDRDYRRAATCADIGWQHRDELPAEMAFELQQMRLGGQPLPGATTHATVLARSET